MSIDQNTCPGCMDSIEQDDGVTLKDTRMHRECYEEATRNTGQAFHPDHPTVSRCSGDCGQEFFGQGLLHFGVTYCPDCAPDEAVAPDYT